MSLFDKNGGKKLRKQASSKKNAKGPPPRGGTLRPGKAGNACFSAERPHHHNLNGKAAGREFSPKKIAM